ncbi:ABC transporter permease [Cupriavidus oxalaticus]|uniref:ABC transporter permease n=1 Tax=Cupriavidus oxalaticus TaxID=96344 RepID=UPI003F734D62
MDYTLNTTRVDQKKTVPLAKPRFALDEFSWIWFGTAVLFAVSAVVAPGTVTKSSLLAMLPFAGILAIVATGQTVVIQQRGLDMSAAGMVTLSGAMVATLGFGTGSMLLAVLGTLAVAVIGGILNGFLTSRLSITPLVATLATNALFIGGVRTITGNSPISVPEPLQAFSHSQLVGLPYSIVLAFLFVVAVWVVTRKTIVGRKFVAVGISPRAAAAAGVPVTFYQIGAYVVSAVCFAVAGLLLAGFIGSASQNAGHEYLMPAIAAVVVGGTPFTGGRGSVIASAVAALFMAQLGQLVLALGASAAIQLLVQAAAILLATAIRNLPAILAGLRRRT